MFGAPLLEPSIFLGIVHFKHHHPRYPKTPLQACELLSYGCLGRHPRTKQYCLALCISNTTILGIQKHLCWPMWYNDMGVWGATPEPKQYFLAVCVSKTTIPVIQKKLCWTMGYHDMGVWGATRNPQIIFSGIGHFKHHHSRYPKTPLPAYGVQWYGWLGRHPGRQTMFVWNCAFQTPTSQVSKNIFAGLWGYGVQWYRCLGRHP